MAALRDPLARPLAFDLALQAGPWSLTAALALESGELGVLTGPTGSGKTSLLRALAGHLQPTRGHVQAGALTLFDGLQKVDLPPWRRPLAVCPQGDTLFPHLTVAANLRFSLKARTAWTERVAPWVETFGLGDLLNLRPRELSGGQRQKVQLARTLACEAAVLLLDEPFGALDPDSHAAVRSALRDHICTSGRCALVVSHTPGDAEALGGFECRWRNGVLQVAAGLPILPLG